MQDKRLKIATRELWSCIFGVTSLKVTSMEESDKFENDRFTLKIFLS